MVAVVAPVVVRDDPDALLTPSEVARLFQVTPKTVGRWYDAGILAGERTEGGHRRFSVAGVLALRAALEEVGAG